MIVDVEQIEKVANQMNEVLIGVPLQISRLRKEIGLCDQESSDLLHLIEFSSFHASEGYKLSRDLQITRQKRRKLKNELATLEQIVDQLNIHRPMNHQTDTIGKVIAKRKRTIANSKYTPKVRSDLAERFNKCNINKLL